MTCLSPRRRSSPVTTGPRARTPRRPSFDLGTQSPRQILLNLPPPLHNNLHPFLWEHTSTLQMVSSVDTTISWAPVSCPGPGRGHPRSRGTSQGKYPGVPPDTLHPGVKTSGVLGWAASTPTLVLSDFQRVHSRPQRGISSNNSSLSFRGRLGGQGRDPQTRVGYRRVRGRRSGRLGGKEESGKKNV